jgi:hypothetical protein
MCQIRYGLRFVVLTAVPMNSTAFRVAEVLTLTKRDRLETIVSEAIGSLLRFRTLDNMTNHSDFIIRSCQ